MMYLDDDVVLDGSCVRELVDQLSKREIYAALAADYLGESRPGEIAHHVSMGATLFRRSVLEQILFRWEGHKCECQCCCNDLRRMLWGIDYCQSAKAWHLPRDKDDETHEFDSAIASGETSNGYSSSHPSPNSAKLS